MQFGFAHLDNDDKLDLIQGFMTEARNSYDVRSPLDYKLHMSSGEWTGPPVKALLARKMLVQDFNRDGKDDVVLLNTGNHKPPLKGLKILSFCRVNLVTPTRTYLADHTYLTGGGGRS